MKTNLIVWGTDANDEKVLILMELMAEDNKVVITTIPENLVTTELEGKLMDEWKNGTQVELPNGVVTIERPLTVSETLLPDDIKTDRTDLIQRAQTQWHFLVLSTKLNKLYESELQEIHTKINSLQNFSQDVWDELKTFWQKVQEQVRDKNLFPEQSNSLRESTNYLFSTMKDLKASMEEEVQKASGSILEQFKSSIQSIEDKINEGGRLQALFDELKQIQSSFRDLKFVREHRSEAWDKLDNAFKILKEKKYGSNATTNTDASPLVRIQRRYDGLLQAIGKMESSIGRDKAELEFHESKATGSDRQLEAMVSQAKLAMIQDRISSKGKKLSEMMKTKAELESKLQDLEQKETVKVDQVKYEAAKKAAQDKIANEIKQAEEARTGEPDEDNNTEDNTPIENAIETAVSISVSIDKPEEE